MTVTYTVGDTREVIKGIADGSVDLIASSPPFLALRSYVPADHVSKGDEIGSEANPAAFIDMLLGLTAEWGRVLAAHGSIAIELGDTYSGSGGAGGDYNEGGLRDGQGKFKQSGWAGYEKRGYHGGPTIEGYRKVEQDEVEMPRAPRGGGNGWPANKSLALIPQLYAVALAYGINPLTGQPSPAGRWLVRNVIVWHRPNPAVGALGDKVRPSTSYIVIATRSPKRWFDLTAVRTPSDYDRPNLRGLGSRSNGTPDGQTHNASDHTTNPAGAPPLDAWSDHYDGTHDTWTLTTQPSSLAHYAMWPAKLAERLVLMMCPREVCTVCGEPRRRMEESTYIPHGDIARQHAEARVLAMANDKGIHGTAQSMVNGRATKVPTTLGWTDCGHDDYRPGMVADVFAGSGTTLAVADLHGRDATGIDFNAANHDLYPARYDEVKKALFGTPLPDRNQMELAL